jgi:hypothetical protein
MATLKAAWLKLTDWLGWQRWRLAWLKLTDWLGWQRWRLAWLTQMA